MTCAERVRDVLWSGTIGGLAMIPFAAVFRACGLRVNEYGRKTLVLLVGEQSPPVYYLLTFIQHIVISWIAAVPLLFLLGRARNQPRVLVGALYGVAFYCGVNSLFLPLAFGDPTPWSLGFSTVYPSFLLHLVFGIIVALTAREPRRP